MDIKNASTTQLKKLWNKHKDEKNPSPVFAQQLKAAAKELKKRGESLNEQTNFMNSGVKTAIRQFIGNIANKDYASAQNSLQQTIAEKIKNKVREHVKNQEK